MEERGSHSLAVQVKREVFKMTSNGIPAVKVKRIEFLDEEQVIKAHGPENEAKLEFSMLDIGRVYTMRLSHFILNRKFFK